LLYALALLKKKTKEWYTEEIAPRGKGRNGAGDLKNVSQQCKKDPIYVFTDMKLRGLVFVPNVHIHVSVSDFPQSVHLFCYSIFGELDRRM
jgi:hypothetical protein